MLLLLPPSAAAQPPAALAAPTGVTASDGAYATKVAITWDAVPRAKNYRIFRGATNAAAAATELGVTGSWVFWDTAAPAGQTFFYGVRAEAGDSQSPLNASDVGFRAVPAIAGEGGTTLGPPPEPAGNPVTAAKAALGKTLFWDEQLSSTPPSPAAPAICRKKAAPIRARFLAPPAHAIPGPTEFSARPTT